MAMHSDPVQVRELRSRVALDPEEKTVLQVAPASVVRRMVLASVATQVVSLRQAGSSAAVPRLDASRAFHPLAEAAVVGGGAVVGVAVVGVAVVGVAVVGVGAVEEVGVTAVEEAVVDFVEVVPQAAIKMAPASMQAPASTLALAMAEAFALIVSGRPSLSRQPIGRQ